MLSKLKMALNKWRLIRDKRIKIGNDTILRTGFGWEIRENPEISPAIIIGERCIVGGLWIVDNSRGRIKFGNDSTIGAGALLVSADSSIEIGNNVVISFNVTFYNTNAHSLDINERKQDVKNTLEYLKGKRSDRGINWDKIVSKDIIVEDDVWIGFGTTILKGVTIGKGSIVGAQSVVTHDVPPYSVVAGNPAKVVKSLKQT